MAVKQAVDAEARQRSAGRDRDTAWRAKGDATREGCCIDLLQGRLYTGVHHGGPGGLSGHGRDENHEADRHQELARPSEDVIGC